MVNTCHELHNCPDLCCFNTSFSFTGSQYSEWKEFAGDPEIVEFTNAEFMTLMKVVGIGRKGIFHSLFETPEGPVDRVQLNRLGCPVRKDAQSGGGCGAWGKFIGCNNFVVGGRGCNITRRNAHLPIIIDE